MASYVQSEDSISYLVCSLCSLNTAQFDRSVSYACGSYHTVLWIVSRWITIQVSSLEPSFGAAYVLTARLDIPPSGDPSMSSSSMASVVGSISAAVSLRVECESGCSNARG